MDKFFFLGYALLIGGIFAAHKNGHFFNNGLILHKKLFMDLFFWQWTII